MKPAHEKRRLYTKAGIVILLLIISIGNGKAIVESYHRLSKLKDSSQELDKIQTETAFLTDEIEYAKTDEFIQKEALERFNMVKDYGTIVVLGGAAPASPTVIQETQQDSPQTHPNKWAAWAKYFNL